MMHKVRHVHCAAVPDVPTASWSNCLLVGQEIALSGMTAHPATRQGQSPLGVYEQTLAVLEKCRALVEAAGGGLHNIYKLVVYVTDIAAREEVGRARRDFFSAPYPCSTLVGVRALVFPELLVEIDAFARLDIDLRTAESLFS